MAKYALLCSTEGKFAASGGITLGCEGGSEENISYVRSNVSVMLNIER
jgi:hypothetical protein